MDLLTSGFRRFIELKAIEKISKDLAWELKKLWHMKVTVIRIAVGALGKLRKDLEKWVA